MDSGTLKIGQKVKINPISKNAKEHYPWGWNSEMDHRVGKIVTISHILKNGSYLVEENIWTWDKKNLNIVEEKG